MPSYNGAHMVHMFHMVWYIAVTDPSESIDETKWNKSKEAVWSSFSAIESVAWARADMRGREWKLLLL